MKRIDLYIPQERLLEIHRLLQRSGVEEVTFYDIRGRGHTKKEPVAVGKGVLRDVPEFGSWIKMEAVVSDEMAGHVIQETLASIGIVGSATDGKIVVCDIAAEFELGDAPP